MEDDREAVNLAIADADHAAKHKTHPHLHHRHQQPEQQQPGVTFIPLIQDRHQ